jgi:hypothetical protein
MGTCCSKGEKENTIVKSLKLDKNNTKQEALIVVNNVDNTIDKININKKGAHIDGEVSGKILIL